MSGTDATGGGVGSAGAPAAVPAVQLDPNAATGGGGQVVQPPIGSQAPTFSQAQGGASAASGAGAHVSVFI